MMHGVKPAVEGGVGMHESVEPVLPSVDDNEAHRDLAEGDAVHIGVVEGEVRNEVCGGVLAPVPHGVELEAGDWMVVELEDGEANGGLDHVLQDDLAQDVEARGLVTLRDLLGRVDAVLLAQLEGVDGVEVRGQQPVGDDGRGEGQDSVRHRRDQRLLGPQLDHGRLRRVHEGVLRRKLERLGRRGVERRHGQCGRTLSEVGDQ